VGDHVRVTDAERYRTALLDWLACAVGGAEQPAARAARAAGDGLLERVAALGTAGHVLDYDDTYAPGVVHLSAAVAPAALVLAAELEFDVAAALEAYAAGFEAAGALARASHPRLYDGGWHPTAVCGAVGAATGAARLLDLDREQTESAQALALHRAGGMRAAFGTDAKAIGVGMAAAAGVHAARLAAAGAQVGLAALAEGGTGFEQVFGGRWAVPDPEAPAIRENWLKPYPCCLGTHSTIEAITDVRAQELEPPSPLIVVVHPLERQAAWRDEVQDGLQAKFSLPYLAAFTWLRGAPTNASFIELDVEASAFAGRAVEVRTDSELGEWASQIEAGGEQLARVEHALGSPQRPLDAARAAAKIHDLAGDRLDGVLDDPVRRAGEILAAAGLHLAGAQ
jgi:2-methylcitrate dehydratase PrpD